MFSSGGMQSNPHSNDTKSRLSYRIEGVTASRKGTDTFLLLIILKRVSTNFWPYSVGVCCFI